MINVAVVEDDAESRKLMRDYLGRFEGENPNVSFSVRCYRNGKEFLDAYSPSTDIVLMDVEMPGIDGMETARLLRQDDGDVTIIFVTRIAQCAVGGYSVGAFDFMLKPVSYAKFSAMMKRTVEARSRRSEPKLQVRSQEGYVWLPVLSVRFIEVSDHDLTYHTETGNYTERNTLASLEERLSGSGFCRCSRYCLVNLRYVTGITEDCVVLGADRVAVSRRYKKNFTRDLLRFNE